MNSFELTSDASVRAQSRQISPLESLPRELRDDIYHHFGLGTKVREIELGAPMKCRHVFNVAGCVLKVWHSDFEAGIPSTSVKKKEKVLVDFKSLRALGRVSKQLYFEIQELLFSGAVCVVQALHTPKDRSTQKCRHEIDSVSACSVALPLHKIKTLVLVNYAEAAMATSIKDCRRALNKITVPVKEWQGWTPPNIELAIEQVILVMPTAPKQTAFSSISNRPKTKLGKGQIRDLEKILWMLLEFEQLNGIKLRTRTGRLVAFQMAGYRAKEPEKIVASLTDKIKHAFLKDGP